MGTQSWGTQTRLIDALEDESYRFEFFQVARLLAVLQRERGYSRKPYEEERVDARFRTSAPLAFPASDVESVEGLQDQDESGVFRKPEVRVPLLGLTGPNGVLPRHYSELVLHQEMEGKRALHEFFDLFSHRFLVLFARSWIKYHKIVEFELQRELGGVARYLMDLLGLGTPGLADRQNVADAAYRPYVGSLGARPTSALALETMISETFGDIPAAVLSFEGAWYDLDPREFAPMSSMQLGVNSVLGTRVWQREFLFRVRLGPLSLSEYSNFLPMAKGFTQVVSMCRFAAGREYDCRVQLVLKRDEVPPLCLGNEGEDGPRLGWTTWLSSEPHEHDPDDAVFTSPSPDNVEAA